MCAKCAAKQTHGSQQGNNTKQHVRWVQRSPSKCSFKFQVIPINFLQSYTSAANRSTALSTTVLPIETIPRPKTLLNKADSTQLSQNKRKVFFGPLYLCARRSEVHRWVSRSETTCRAVAARGFAISLSPQLTAACAAARIRRRGCSWMVGPFPRSRSRSSASAVGVRRLRHNARHTESTQVHQEKNYTARGMPAYIEWRRIPSNHKSCSKVM